MIMYQKGLKSGFTLVETLVTLAVFGLLAIISTDFFLQVVRNSNQATMKNEVRQNANRILQDITSEIRKSSQAKFVSDISSSTLTLTYPTTSATVIYTFGNDGVVTKSTNGVATTMNSDNVSVIDCPGACGNCSVSGFSISPQDITTNASATMTVIVQQNPTKFSTSDFCTRFIATDSATPRQY